jgi:polyisoprenoid-binding protein YceI
MAWYIDPHHSNVTFGVRHMMVSTVRGSFGGLRGTIEYDPEHPERTKIDAVINAATVNTADDRRDAHLRSPDFFDAENHPEIRFNSTAVEAKGGDRYAVTGEVTIRGVTRVVTADVELAGIGTDGKGLERLGAEATFSIDRKEFGLVWNQPVQNGVLVGDKVKLEIGISALDASTAKQWGLAA